MDIDLRRLIDTQHPVVVEVRLLDPSRVDDDFAVERRGQAEDQAALELRHNGIRVDDDAGIDRRSDSAQMYFALFVDFGFHHGCDEAGKRRLHTDTTPDTRRQRFTPIGFFGRQIERRETAWLISKHRPAEVNRILAGLPPPFVHETLNRKHVVEWFMDELGPKAGKDPVYFRPSRS